APIEPGLLDADAAIRRIVVGPVLVIADPALGFVLYRARGAGDALLGGILVALSDLAAAGVCAGPGQTGQQDRRAPPRRPALSHPPSPPLTSSRRPGSTVA